MKLSLIEKKLSASNYHAGETSVGSKSSSVSLQDYVRSVPIVGEKQNSKDMMRIFAEHPDNECAVVCNEVMQPVGLVMKDPFYVRLGKRFGEDLYLNRYVTKLMDEHPLIVHSSFSPSELIDIALTRDEAVLYDCVIVIEQNSGALAGVLTVADLLKLSRALQNETASSQQRLIEATKSHIHEIVQAISKVKASSKEGEAISHQLVDSSTEGKQGLDLVTEAMTALVRESQTQETRMHELAEEAGSIGRISAFIKELAEQSNLIAINASIEAARAGEHGRGFSVVAEEIMRLAVQTKRSANEITAFTASITGAIERLSALSVQGRASSEHVNRFAEQASASFTKIMFASEANRESADQIEQLTEQARNQTLLVANKLEQLEKQYF